MEVQQEISLQKNQAMIGQTYRILVDRKEGNFFVGRTEGDSPEVDNEVLVNAEENFLRVGDFATIKINDASDYDLFGGLVEEQ